MPMIKGGGTIREFVAAWQKMRESGWDNLSPREREVVEGGTEAVNRLRESPGFQRSLDRLKAQMDQPETIAGLEAFEALSPQDQQRFGEWTPAELFAVLSVLDLKDIEEK